MNVDWPSPQCRLSSQRSQRKQTADRTSSVFRWIALVICGISCCDSSQVQAAPDWQPRRTWLFAVGVLEWQRSDLWPSMPNAQHNRRDVQFVEHFRAAGLPERQIVYLQDRQATRQHIQQRFVGLLKETRPGDLLLFYYAGHGSRDRKHRRVHFANYDAADSASAWSMPAILDTIDQHFHGDRTLLMVDCCYSGGLADEVQRRKSRVSYGFLCSAFSHNSSTGRWTFTDALLKGFRGNAAVDLNADGDIEFEEMGHYAELDMGFMEQQKSVYGRTSDFPPRMKLAAATGVRTQKLGDRIEAEWRGKWYRAQVIDARQGTWRIHYVNFDHSWDEWIGAERMRAFSPPQYPAGARVQIHWPEDGKWYPGTIVRTWYGLSLVHYTDYPSEWDEWVGPEAVRQ